MRISRRAFATSAGAALLLSPFYRLLGGGERGARAAGPGHCKRLLLFCTMGTNPDVWTPTGVTGENAFTFSESTSPLAAIKGDVVLLEGLPSGNPADGHGAPDGLTGLGYAGGPKMLSVDQFVADKLAAAGVTRPIPSLLLGANTNASGGRTMFYRGNNLPTIGSPMSAYGTVFGAAAPAMGGPSADALLRRRKSVLDNLRGEIGELNQAVGADERARLQLHLDSIRQIETRLSQTMPGGGGGACMKPAALAADPPNDLQANLAHLDIIMGAFACDITRVAAIEFGSDQSLPVDLPDVGLKGDEHGGFLHSGAPMFKNLITFEKWLAQRFVDVVNKLKTIPEADGSGTLFDNTLVAWCRDMGDAVNHNQKSMRFVLAGGAGGYLRRNPAGRYLKLAGGTADRHERVLLNLCEAMGVTSFAGFGDPALTDKTPLSTLIV